MATDPFVHFVFVDFENVPGVDLGLMEGKPVHVSLLIGKNQKKLDLALVQQIHRLASQVELVEVGASGHNALDLTLAYYLGRAVERGPTALFHIVSKDKDFEPMIGHLLVEGIKVARCDAIAALPFLAPTVRATVAPFPRQARAAAPARSAAPTKPGAQTKPLPADRHLKIIERLWNPANRNRPASLDALLKYLKTSLGKKSPETEVQDLLRELKQQGVLTIAADGKVVYASAE